MTTTTPAPALTAPALTADDLKATFDAFNRHDIDAVMTHFADDCVFFTVAGDHEFGNRIEGKPAIAKARRQPVDLPRHQSRRNPDRGSGRRPVPHQGRPDRRETGDPQAAPRPSRQVSPP